VARYTCRPLATPSPRRGRADADEPHASPAPDPRPAARRRAPPEPGRPGRAAGPGAGAVDGDREAVVDGPAAVLDHVRARTCNRRRHRDATGQRFDYFVAARLDPTRDKKIAMFCTGGIRCEKASTYLLEKGFEEVYQLNGGILNYLETVSPEESLWEGECFVFDSRVAVNENLETGDHELCYGCRHPLSPEDLQSEKYHPGVCCPYCYDRLTKQQRDRFTERWRQQQLAKQRNEKHVGADMPKRYQNRH